MICHKCGEERGDDFPPGKRACRPCHAAAMRARYAADPEKYRAANRARRQPSHPDYQDVLARNRQYRADNPDIVHRWQRDSKRKSHGWAKGEFELAVAAQNGLCAIPGCGRPASDADHCHQGGHARGAICSGCNKALGLLADSVDRLTGLIAYLQANCGAMCVAGLAHPDYRDAP